jgi:hypothetical protein
VLPGSKALAGMETAAKASVIGAAQRAMGLNGVMRVSSRVSPVGEMVASMPENGSRMPVPERVMACQHAHGVMVGNQTVNHLSCAGGFP